MRARTPQSRSAAKQRAPHVAPAAADDVVEIHDLREQFAEMDEAAAQEAHVAQALQRSVQMAEMTGELEDGMRSLMQGGGGGFG